jgi:hypothetical protein
LKSRRKINLPRKIPRVNAIRNSNKKENNVDIKAVFFILVVKVTLFHLGTKIFRENKNSH